jgi:hypothetical protein
MHALIQIYDQFTGILTFVRMVMYPCGKNNKQPFFLNIRYIGTAKLCQALRDKKSDRTCFNTRAVCIQTLINHPPVVDVKIWLALFKIPVPVLRLSYAHRIFLEGLVITAE